MNGQARQKLVKMSLRERVRKRETERKPVQQASVKASFASFLSKKLTSAQINHTRPHYWPVHF